MRMPASSPVTVTVWTAAGNSTTPVAVSVARVDGFAATLAAVTLALEIGDLSAGSRTRNCFLAPRGPCGTGEEEVRDADGLLGLLTRRFIGQITGR